MFLKNAIIGTIGFSFFYNVQEYFGNVLPDLSGLPITAAILGGVFVGVGAGIIVYSGGASGGDDALAIIISKIFKCRISKAYFVADAVVLILSLTYIPFAKIIYSFITVTVSSLIVGKIHSYKN